MTDKKKKAVTEEILASPVLQQQPNTSVSELCPWASNMTQPTNCTSHTFKIWVMGYKFVRTDLVLEAFADFNLANNCNENVYVEVNYARCGFAP